MNKQELYGLVAICCQGGSFLAERDFSTRKDQTWFGFLLWKLNGKWLSNGCRINISGSKNCRKYLFENAAATEKEAEDVVS